MAVTTPQPESSAANNISRDEYDDRIDFDARSDWTTLDKLQAVRVINDATTPNPDFFEQDLNPDQDAFYSHLKIIAPYLIHVYEDIRSYNHFSMKYHFNSGLCWLRPPRPNNDEVSNLATMRANYSARYDLRRLINQCSHAHNVDDVLDIRYANTIA